MGQPSSPRHPVEHLVGIHEDVAPHLIESRRDVVRVEHRGQPVMLNHRKGKQFDLDRVRVRQW